VTGMRKSEILGSTWDRIDMKEKVIRLPRKETKSGRPRLIPYRARVRQNVRQEEKVVLQGARNHLIDNVLEA